MDNKTRYGSPDGILTRISCFVIFRVMKNVTITLAEDVALWLRVRAAEQNRSVSRWLAELIEGMRTRGGPVRDRDGALPRQGEEVPKTGVGRRATANEGRVT